MRLLMNVTMPHEPFNTAVRDGSVGETIERILKETGPEAVYFTERNVRIPTQSGHHSEAKPATVPT